MPTEGARITQLGQLWQPAQVQSILSFSKTYARKPSMWVMLTHECGKGTFASYWHKNHHSIFLPFNASLYFSIFGASVFYIQTFLFQRWAVIECVNLWCRTRKTPSRAGHSRLKRWNHYSSRNSHWAGGHIDRTVLCYMTLSDKIPVPLDLVRGISGNKLKISGFPYRCYLHLAQPKANHSPTTVLPICTLI